MSNELNIFEAASRLSLSFESTRGDLNVDRLWGIPLESKGDFSLDAVAKTVKRKLDSLSEESFVSTAPNPERKKLELSLEIVKHIIAVRLLEKENNSKAASRKAERERLIAILDDKQTEEARSLTKEELRARIDSLA